MNELDELRLKVAKALGWRYVKLTPTPDNDVILPKRDRTCYQIYTPGEINDNPFWTATEMEWPENWQKTYRASEVPNWPRDIAAAYALENEIPEEDRPSYLKALYNMLAPGILGKVSDNPTSEEINKANNDYMWAMVHSTPEQRCRAYLAWKEANT